MNNKDIAEQLRKIADELIEDEECIKKFKRSSYFDVEQITTYVISVSGASVELTYQKIKGTP